MLDSSSSRTRAEVMYKKNWVLILPEASVLITPVKYSSHFEWAMLFMQISESANILLMLFQITLGSLCSRSAKSLSVVSWLCFGFF